MKSWKTTVLGIGTMLTAAFGLIAKPLLDSDPETCANYAAFLPLLMAGIASLFARDNDKSSEDIGAKK